MKKLLSLFLAITVLLSLVAIVPVNAASVGSTATNPLNISLSTNYSKIWTSSNDDEMFFIRFTIAKRGVAKITIQKPVDDEWERFSYNLKLFNSSMRQIWGCDTEPEIVSFSDYYVYEVGLNAGTYILCVNPSFYLYSDSAPITTAYRVDFAANDYWEIESNNFKENATPISIDKMYTGIYCEEDYDSTYEDWYAVKLKKNSTYTIKINNYGELEAGTTIIDFMDYYGNEVDEVYFGYSNSEINGAVHSVTYVAKSTGTYYLKIHNDGNSRPVKYGVGVYKYRISANTLSIKLSTKNYTYDGKSKKPKVVVKDSLGIKIPSSNYTVTYPSGRKAVGSYKVKVTFKGDYEGTKTLTFKINPKATKIKTLKAGKKAFTVKYSKQTSGSGYEILYSTTKKFKSAKTVKITKNKTVSKTVNKLKSKKTYYVRVRTVKGSYKSAWSTAKKVKTK